MKAVIVIIFIVNLSREISARDDNYLEFPDEFSIGAATSAYQIEGAWNVSGKAESIWDWWTHEKPSLFENGDNGDIACDSYHKYKEDVELTKNMGLNHYRFSLSWSRILPTGSPNKVNSDGIQYYKNVIDELLINGIEPYVTLHHYDDLRLLFENTGGWVNESMIGYFEDYSRVVFRELGSRVKFWTTFNEVNIYCIDYVNETTALDSAHTARYLCAHNILKAHARAYHIYNEEFRSTQTGKVGLIVSSAAYYPMIANDTESAKVAFDFETGWIMHPIFSESGDYPEIMKQRVADNSREEGLSYSRLPEFSPYWIDYIKGSADYFGLNHYKSWMVETVSKIDGKWLDDSGIRKSLNPNWSTTSMDNFTVVPESIRIILMYIKNSFNNPPVYILENGCAVDTELVDIDRISYLYSYMKEVLLAVQNGCAVKAYTIWSLLDNFEWFFGYSKHFGLVKVDFRLPNRTRTPKLSSQWLKVVMRSGKLVPYNKTTLPALN